MVCAHIGQGQEPPPHHSDVLGVSVLTHYTMKEKGDTKSLKSAYVIYERYLRTPMGDHGHWPRFVRLLLCLLDHPLDVGQQYY